MLVETVLANLLLADPEVTALVGGRVYYKHLPRDPTFPAIVYHSITEPPSDNTVGIFQPRLQYDCSAITPAGAKELAKIVRDSLHGSKHKGIYEDVRISFIEYQGMNPGESDPDTGLETVLVDFIVTTTET